MNRLVIIFVFLLTIFSTTITVAQQLSYHPEVLDYALELEITKAPTQTYRAYVLLKDQVNITELNRQFDVLRANRAQRARTVVKQLKDKAAQSQAGLLRELQGSTEVVPGSIKPFWITNMIQIEATGNYLAKLSLHPAVERIEEASVEQIHKDKTAVPEAPTMLPNGREPGLTAIKAHKLWELGYSGYGTQVMIIDTEIDFNHPALRTQFLYNNVPVEQAYFGQITGEFCFDHGTTVVGIVLGLDRLTNDTIGAAFNAKYMNAPIPFVDEDGNECVPPGERTNSVDALQYALDPDGNPNTTSDIPDVINNSYGTPIRNSVDCQNPIQRNIFTNLDAAGVSVIFSAGNAGPEEGTLNLQSSLNFDLYVPFVVGSIESNNTISEFSSRGPSLCIDGPNSFKPDVVAPGSNIRTSRPGNGYTSISGTSFSAPYVTGAVLLLKEAFPNLPGRRLNEALTLTATDLGSAGDDNIFGEGLIDVYAAYNWLIDQGHTPTPALRSANDAILTNVETRNVECGRMIQPILTVTNNGTQDITSLEIRFQRESDRSNLSPVNWTGRIPVGESKKITIGPINTFTGNYTLLVNLARVNDQVDLRALDNVIKEAVNVSDQPIDTEIRITGQQICQGGQSMLVATSNTGDDLRWYDALVGGNQVAVGDRIILDNVQRDTTLFASISSITRLGMERPDLGPNTFLSQNAGLVFDAQSAFILKTVKLFAETPGVRVIQLKSPNAPLQQKVVPITRAGEQEVELGFNVLPGEDIELIMSVGGGLAVTTNQTQFPYTVEDIVRITRSKGTVATFYAYFYDWEIEFENSCGRVAAQIQVDNSGQAPNIDFEADQYLVDIINQSGATVSFTSTSENLVSYKWSFGDGFTSTQANPIYTYTEPGIYDVTLYGTTADGCSNMAVKTVEVRLASSTKTQDLIASRIHLFPNPAQASVNLSLQFPDNKSVQYEIFDLLGKSYGRTNLGQISQAQIPVDIRNLPGGTYLLMLNVDGTRVGKRLVKFE